MARMAYLAAISAVCLGGCAGDAYSTYQPEQKQVVPMFLSKSVVLSDQIDRLIAYLFTPSPSHYVVGRPWFGQGIEVETNSGEGQGCVEADPDDVIAPDLWEETHVFPVCVTLIPQPGAPLGGREVTIEVVSDGAYILGREEDFFVVAP